MAAGAMIIHSSLSKDNSPSADAFNKWYNDKHIPDIFAAGAISAAFRYELLNPNATSAQFLAVYPVKDLAALASPEMQKVPMEDEIFGGASIVTAVELAPWAGVRVQLYEPQEGGKGPAQYLITAGITPSPNPDADLDTWYQTEHLAELAAVPGYRRTRRYAGVPVPGGEGGAKFCALHEFDDLVMSALEATGQTELGKRIMGTSEKVEIKAWRLIAARGDKWEL